MFDRPPIWKWEQGLTPREKFVVGTCKKNDAGSEKPENIEVTIRKTDEFTTLQILRGSYTADGTSPQIREYTLNQKGEIRHTEKMDKEDYKIYAGLKQEIKKAVGKMNEMYARLYV